MEIRFVGGVWDGYKFELPASVMLFSPVGDGQEILVGIPRGQSPETALRWSTATIETRDVWKARQPSLDFAWYGARPRFGESVCIFHDRGGR